MSLSWLTGFNGILPITAIEVDIISSSEAPFKHVFGNINMTTITGLMPFTEYTFSVAVINLAGQSETVNITATTLSLSMSHDTIIFHC